MQYIIKILLCSLLFTTSACSDTKPTQYNMQNMASPMDFYDYGDDIYYQLPNIGSKFILKKYNINNGDKTIISDDFPKAKFILIDNDIFFADNGVMKKHNLKKNSKTDLCEIDNIPMEYTPDYIAVYNNVVYYLNYDKLLKISNNKKSIIKENIADTYISPKNIIYSDFDGNMYECDIKGENSRLIISTDAIYKSGMYDKQITDNMQTMNNILLCNDKIYFILKNSPDEGGKMYSCDLEGNNLTYYDGAYTYAFQLQIVNDKIYYAGLNDDDKKSKFALYEYDISTQNIKKIRNGISSF